MKRVSIDTAILMLMPSRLLFLLGFSALVHGLTNPYLIPAMERGITQYLVFHSELRANYTMSRSRCLALGGELADIDSLQALQYLTQRIPEPAFISAFLIEQYPLGEDECIAAYPGGAVAVPEASCQSLMDSICEVPLLGTGSIHLNDAVQLAMPRPEEEGLGSGSEGGSSKHDLPSIKQGFFRVAAGKADKVIKAKADNVVTTRVTIFGSVETNPALPCCKCCGG